MNHRRVLDRFATRSRDSFSIWNFQTVSGAHLASYSVGFQHALLQGVKRPGCKSDHSSQSNYEFKNERSHTSTAPFLFNLGLSTGFHDWGHSNFPLILQSLHRTFLVGLDISFSALLAPQFSCHDSIKFLFCQTNLTLRGWGRENSSESFRYLL